eukprot:c52423_g1_i1.p1 GENE.c52423_g1_i1~~c52423_g1_i1.p1  ORF type:complete len:194 (-),score=46.23 c52423_g1_i1:82-663(-)
MQDGRVRLVSEAFPPDLTLEQVVLGDGGVGKSALIFRVVHKEFLSHYDPTVSDSWTTVIPSLGCELELLDTSGMETMKTSFEFIQKAQAPIFVYNVVDRASFASLDARIQEFLSLRRDKFPMIILGNKCDLAAERVVSKEEGQMLANQYNCDFFETSAKTALNVLEAFSCISKRVLNPEPSAAPKRQKRCVFL